MEEQKSPELIAGLKNALSRGETLQKAKNSLLNAGYSKEEIELASQKINPEEFKQEQPPQSPPPQKQTQTSSESKKEIKQLPQQKPIQKKFSKKTKILAVILLILVLISAALLGIFWQDFF